MVVCCFSPLENVETVHNVNHWVGHQSAHNDSFTQSVLVGWVFGFESSPAARVNDPDKGLGKNPLGVGGLTVEEEMLGIRTQKCILTRLIASRD